MAQALPMVKKLVTSLVESGSKVPRWVLTNFKDPDVELVTSTGEVEILREMLDELKYGGGGDIWEQTLKGKGEPHGEIYSEDFKQSFIRLFQLYSNCMICKSRNFVSVQFGFSDGSEGGTFKFINFYKIISRHK